MKAKFKTLLVLAAVAVLAAVDTAAQEQTTSGERRSGLLRSRFGRRTGDGMPVALQYSYTPYKYIGDIDISMLEGSFDRYMDSKGLSVSGFLTKLKAVEGNEKQLDLLQAKSKALLKSVSTRYINDITPVQCTESLYRSDLFEYTFSSF